MTTREFAIQVVRQLQAAGFEALWAGGCVRDELMGRIPKDYDVATNARPEQVRKIFGYKRTIPIGVAFGVITVIGPQSAGQIEVATFRRDSQYSDGRHPDSIEFSNAREDALRRDFTINGMFFDPIQSQVLDYVGGQRDLKEKIIRAIGDPTERIHEDKLRMLRAIRFAATFDFQLEADTLSAIQENATKIQQISAERIGAEIVRMLSHPSRSVALKLLVVSSLLPELLPAGWFVASDWQGSQIDQSLSQLNRLRSDCFEPAAVLMLRPCLERLEQEEIAGSKSTARSLSVGLGRLQDKWKLTNQQRETMEWISRNWKRLAAAEKLRWCELQPLLISDAIELALSTAESIVGDSSSLQLCRERLAWPKERLNPPLLISGQDLIRRGFQPGPAFKTILQEVRDRQLEGELVSVEEAIEFATRRLS